MAAIQSKDIYNRSFEMAEDNMEISSEFGERIVEDDIDIDIDFAPEHHDEDHILDDVTSEVDNDIRMQRSPAVINDDIMIDEDNASVPMDDADFIQEPHQPNLQAEAVQVFELPEQASTDSGVHPEISDFHEENLSNFTSNDIAPSQQTWPETEQLDLHAQEGPSEESWNKNPDVEPQPVPATVEEPAAGSSPHKEAEQNVTSEVPSTVDELAPPSETAVQPQSEAAQDYHTTDRDPPAASESDEHGNHKDSLGEHTESDEILIEKIIVVYQGAEYALTRATENDDPDSYFLNDHSLIYEPLSKMFEALREVLGDEIPVEDELYLSVEELKLDTNETSASAYNTTFSQIVDLHDMLHRNDGIDDPGTLFVTLGFKPNFSKRFAALVKDAAAGKGFSHVIGWDNESQNVDDENTSGEPNDDNVPSTGEDKSDDVNGVVTESGLSEVIKHEDQNNTGVAADEFQATVSLEVEGEEHPLIGPLTNGASSDHVPNPSTEHDHRPHAEGDSQERRDNEEDEEDEDGDLIDYEDEEYEHTNKTATTTPPTNSGRNEDGTFTDFFTPCLKPDTCFCSRCNELLLAEYEAINEELRRRSLSRATDEDEQAYQASNISTAANLDSEVVAPQTLTDDTENIENPENDVDYEDHEDFDEVNQTDALADEAYNDESAGTALDLPQTNNTDEIDYDQGLETAEAFESNESENTLIGDEFVKYDEDNEEPQDEIDYEDDDHLESNNNLEHDAEKEIPPPNANSGKRAREGEDTVDEDLKESKRVRS